MPSKEILRANSVNENQVLPHLRKKLGGSSSVSNSVSVGTTILQPTIKVVAGENIAYGSALAIADGKAYKAQTTSADNKAAVMISVSSANTNEMVECVNAGEIVVAGADFDTAANIFVQDNGGLSTEIPTYIAGKYIQRVGRAISQDRMIVNIESAMHAK